MSNEHAAPDVACSALLGRGGLTLPSRLHLLLLNDSGTLSRDEREDVKEARDEIERLRADAARLDWLESQEECEVGRMGTSVTYWCVIGEMVGGSGTGPTLRAAIDQARAGTAA